MKITIVFPRGAILSAEVRERVRECLTLDENKTVSIRFLKDAGHWAMTFHTKNLASTVLYGLERDGFDLSADFASITIN